MATPKKKVQKKSVAKTSGKKPVSKRVPKKPIKKLASKKTTPKKAVKVMKKPANSKTRAVVRAAVGGAKAKAAAANQDKAMRLITKGKERGYITYSEILKEFPHIEEDVTFLDELYERFTIAGIDILEGGMLEDNADEYLATRNIKGRDSS